VRADDLGTIEIVITDRLGNPISRAHYGEIIMVNVYLSGFRMLSQVMPSLHFNPSLLQVCDSEGKKLIGYRRLAREYFQFNPTQGWSFFPNEIRHPFVNNTTGVIGVWVTSPNVNRNWMERRRLYSIYMKVVGGGETTVRLSRQSDGDGKSNPRDYYDRNIFDSITGAARYAIYFPVDPRSQVTDVIEIPANIELIGQVVSADITIGRNEIDENTVKATTTAEIFNNTHFDKDLTLFLALYDADNRLQEFSFVNGTINPGERDTLNTEIYLPVYGTGYYLKAFLWKQGVMINITDYVRYFL